MMDEDKIRQAVKLLLEGIGEDPNREGGWRRPRTALPGCAMRCSAVWRRMPRSI